jgi:hypothetical protein
MTICKALPQLRQDKDIKKVPAPPLEKFITFCDRRSCLNGWPSVPLTVATPLGAGVNGRNVMASIDIQEAVGPRKDGLGLTCFFFHLAVGAFTLTGWLISSYGILMFYMMLLPAMAAQWVVNRRSCIINNLESWIRTGHWHDPQNCEEGGFLLMLSDWFFAVRPSPVAIDRFSYCVVFALWLLALGHMSWMTMA